MYLWPSSANIYIQQWMCNKQYAILCKCILVYSLDLHFNLHTNREIWLCKESKAKWVKVLRLMEIWDDLDMQWMVKTITYNYHKKHRRHHRMQLETIPYTDNCLIISIFKTSEKECINAQKWKYSEGVNTNPAFPSTCVTHFLKLLEQVGSQQDFTTQFLSYEYKTRHLGPPGCFSKTNLTD